MDWLALIQEVLVGLAVSIWGGVVGLVKWFFPESFYKNVSGDIALVTGGGGGIGRLMAKKLAARGAVIVTVDLKEEWNRETVREIEAIGGKAHAYTCDLSDRHAVYALAEKVKAEVGTVSILINNAGIVSGRPLLETPDEKIELTFKVNALAHFWTVKAFLPDMIEQRKGHLVSIASLAGIFGNAKLVDYCASKFAAVGMAESLLFELDRFGHSEYIKNTLVCPYYIKTPLFQGAKSKVIPILEPEYVAEETVRAVLTDTEMLVLPWYTKYLMWVKAVAPVAGYQALSDAFGVKNSMDYWTGRGEEETEKKAAA